MVGLQSPAGITNSPAKSFRFWPTLYPRRPHRRCRKSSTAIDVNRWTLLPSVSNPC